MADVFTPQVRSLSLDRWEMMDFCKHRDFTSILDAWEHAGKHLPKGSFVQVFDQCGKLRAWGFTGSRIQTPAIILDSEGEEHA